MEPQIKDENRLDERWVSVLRQRPQEESEGRSLQKAWNWIEENAYGISLREAVEKAVDALISSEHPDWLALVPLGHWTRHRERPDLLNHVLVESNGDPRGVPTNEAILANPYVEHARDRRLLFPKDSAIVATYLEQDPAKTSAPEWRAFFEKAKARGGVDVRASEEIALRGDKRRVAEFLGLDEKDVGSSNIMGYRLLDFDIAPSLPDPDASEKVRSALASWLSDGFRILKDRGRRQCSYKYGYEVNRIGNTQSVWVTKLSELAWVPCNDGELRCPRHVLPSPDLARHDAPTARLSPELLSVLEQEGVKFGEAIPEVPSLRRLLTLGSILDAEDLAKLLSECREQISTDADKNLFEHALRNLKVPLVDNQRVPLERIAQRVGGRSRGGLGGWVVPLDDINESLRTELTHPDFPRDFPGGTTGGQALDYIQEVWKRARTAPEGLANEVRQVLPTAYAYCLEDCAEDTALDDRWDAVKSKAAVFADREWIFVNEADDIYFDNIEDRRFFPSHVQLRTVTGGHLGPTRTEQLRTAEKIGLSFLSSIVGVDWIEGKVTPVTVEWVFRFELICKLLRVVRGNDLVEGNKTDTEPGSELTLCHTSELSVNIRVDNAATERVPVNARLHKGALTVAGRPIEFGADAAKELLREFSFGQRADLAADLTGMLTAIGAEHDFHLAAEKFKRSYAPTFELQVMSPGSLDSETAGNPEGKRPHITVAVTGLASGEKKPASVSMDTSSVAQNSDLTKSEPLQDVVKNEAQIDGSERTKQEEANTTGGPYNKGRALAQQKALADKLKRSLMGEIVSDHEPEDMGDSRMAGGTPGTGLGDEVYRKVAAQYERVAGRKPTLGDPLQTGWDIRSTDPKTKEVRMIEVKGKGSPWDKDEVVVLSRAQVRKAFEATDEQTRSSWYLYVVEKTDNGEYHVLPIANPVDAASKWILCGESWRMTAENPKCFDAPPN